MQVENILIFPLTANVFPLTAYFPSPWRPHSSSSFNSIAVPVGIIINSGLKIKIFKEFLENPIVNRSAMRRGRRVTEKNSVVFSLTGKE